jgi:hypothetical protein
MGEIVNKQNWEFLRVWQKDVSEYHAGVSELWRLHARLSEDEIQSRLKQLILIVKFKGEIVGVSTAYLQRVKLLNNHEFAFYRNFVNPQFRIAGLDFKITKLSVEELEETYPQTEAQPVKGVITVLENDYLKKSPTMKKAIWVNVPFIFIGNTSAGHPIRVCYFKNAKV